MNYFSSLRFKTYFIILLLGFCTSSVSSGAEQSARLEQPNTIGQVNQLFTLRLTGVDEFEVDINGHYFLRPSSSPEQGVDAVLEASRNVQLLSGRDAIIEEFWGQFEQRAQELGIEPGERGLNGKAAPYDKYLDNYADRENNPVQRFLIDRMGLIREESGNFYKQLQIGYLIGGLGGAELAWREQVEELLREEMVFLARNIKKLDEVLKLKLADELLGAHSRQTDPAARLAETFIEVLYRNTSHPMYSFLKQTLAEDGVNVNDKDKTEESLVGIANTMIADPMSGRLLSVLEGPEEWYRNGIEHEKDPNKKGLHAFGPKSRTARVNRSIMNVLRFQGLLGLSLNESMASAEAVMKHSSEVLEHPERRDVLDYVEGLAQKTHVGSGNSCLDLLYRNRNPPL